MFSVSPPERLLEEISGSYRQVISPPSGDLNDPDVAPIDAVIQEETQFGPAIRLMFRLDDDDWEYFRQHPDAGIMFTLFSPVMPIISAQVY
jgi:hypothetical protein